MSKGRRDTVKVREATGEEVQAQVDNLTRKIDNMTALINRLKADVPIEGEKWQRHMVAHYENQRRRLEVIRDGLTKS